MEIVTLLWFVFGWMFTLGVMSQVGKLKSGQVSLIPSSRFVDTWCASMQIAPDPLAFDASRDLILAF